MAQGIKREAIRTMNCIMCNKKVLERKIGRLWYLPQKYCSEECQAAGRLKAIPERHCLECGTPIEARMTFRKSGPATGRVHSRYKPEKYCSLKCVGMAAHKRQLGKARGRYVDKHGYVILTSRKGDDGYQQPEHRAIMEKHLGRKLRDNETVHHKNGIRHDNRLENLELWQTNHGKGQRSSDLDIWSGMIPPYQVDCRL